MGETKTIQKFFSIGLFLLCGGLALTDIVTDIMVAMDARADAIDISGFQNIQNDELINFYLVVAWIIISDVLHSTILARFLCKNHALISKLPVVFRGLLITSVPFLLGPLVINLCCAYLVYQDATFDSGTLIKYVLSFIH